MLVVVGRSCLFFSFEVLLFVTTLYNRSAHPTRPCQAERCLRAGSLACTPPPPVQTTRGLIRLHVWRFWRAATIVALRPNKARCCFRNFGTMSYFVFYKYPPLSQQRKALFPHLFGPGRLFGQRGGYKFGVPGPAPIQWSHPRARTVTCGASQSAWAEVGCGSNAPKSPESQRLPGSADVPLFLLRRLWRPDIY